ncbi:MAG TPA: acetyl/propionyl/methylcrotonyl-CoA carboxylase subunit alpha [Candidatus Elarobacter sp.]
MFDKILIANRGEIACRVIKTARRLGVRTVAVCSEADARARHVRLADEAVTIGPPAARDSYLNSERILDAARRTGAPAIHPGYGFLSENADFADACARADIVFIGPPAVAIRAMGSKSAARQLMETAGVPLVPGYHGERLEPAYLQQMAEKIGYPILIKASAGGGGKGMRAVTNAADFGAALTACKREAAASFGDDRVLVEKYLARPRHIEIQVFADTHGNTVHLFERDCSVQRRHQKVIEEAPAPGMTDVRRRQMGDAAVAAARVVGYVGAGTVEFIADQNGAFYFIEMNTRLQVEHPVTEMITGVDLVEWQLRVAAGERLPLAQEQLAIRGHALEARIYAEDPAKGFLPSPGKLIHLSAPAESAHVRVDTGVEQGDEITPYYDPLIAKLIVWDENRESARERMRQALAQYRVVGAANNVEFLRRVIESRSFADAALDTGLIERERAALFADRETSNEAYLIAALATLLHENEAARQRAARFDDPHSPWARRDGWRLNFSGERLLSFRRREREQAVLVVYDASGYQLRIDDTTTSAHGALGPNATLHAEFAGTELDAAVVSVGDTLHVFLDGDRHVIVRIDPWHSDDERGEDEAGLKAPMSGKIVALLVSAGTRVAKGAPLLVLEAMKMEHTITAPAAGKIGGFPFAVGEQVSEGVNLVDFEIAKEQIIETADKRR